MFDGGLRLVFSSNMRSGYVWWAVVAAALAEVDAGCTPMATLKKHMPEWVGLVPYSHWVNKTWGYPTDCSGFVSWAVQAKVGHDLKAYEYGSHTYATRIPTDSLQYGDIITHVWAPAWGPNRCAKKESMEDVGTGDEEYLADDKPVEGLLDYLPGHVFFFDRWDDEETKTEFWAYESSEKSDQTKECLEKGARYCFNHHVKKKRKQVDKWRSDNCTSSQYGWVLGGPHRLSASLLCRNEE